MKKLVFLFLSLLTAGSLFQACDDSKTYADSGPPFDEVEPLNFHDEESVVHTVLEDFYAVGTLADELTDGFHMEAHGYAPPFP